MSPVPSSAAQPCVPAVSGQIEPREHELESSIRAGWSDLASLLQAAAGAREPLGELLVLAERITREQLEQALVERARGEERLGEILVHHGWISGAEVEAVLAFQRDQDGRQGPLRLGNLLVALGVISAEQLSNALKRQRGTRQKLGALLVEAGYADAGQVLHALSMQRRLLKVALVTLLSVCVAVTGPAVIAEQKSRQIGVTATVLPVVSVDVQQQVPRLTISQADLARGFVEVAAASTLHLKSNTRNGVMLSFNALPGLFKAVQVTGLSTAVDLPGDGGAVLQRTAPNEPLTLQLGYRFTLAADAQPGEYAWPVVVTVHAL